MHVFSSLHSILLSSGGNKPANLGTNNKKKTALMVVCLTLQIKHNWYLYNCFWGSLHVTI